MASLTELAKTLKIPVEFAKLLGKNALLSQIGAGRGLPTTRCEDCRTAGQYTGDLERDLGWTQSGSRGGSRD